MSTKVETIHAVSHRKVQSALAALAILLVLPLGGAAVVSMLGNGSSGEVVTEDLSTPLGNGTSAAIILQRYSGDITINALFAKIDERIYQSPGYDQAIDRVQITVSSGAGTVSVSTK